VGITLGYTSRAPVAVVDEPDLAAWLTNHLREARTTLAELEEAQRREDEFRRTQTTTLLADLGL